MGALLRCVTPASFFRVKTLNLSGFYPNPKELNLLFDALAALGPAGPAVLKYVRRFLDFGARGSCLPCPHRRRPCVLLLTFMEIAYSIVDGRGVSPWVVEVLRFPLWLGAYSRLVDCSGPSALRLFGPLHRTPAL